MTMTDEKQRKAADAQFKKEGRASEAMSEYNAAREAERAKTERLAKEAAAEKKL